MKNKALLVVSFGTSYNDTREKTIDVIEEDLKNAFPERKFYRAWTSKIITAKMKERDSAAIDMPEEAFEKMKADGITDVLIQPSFILPGLEYDYLVGKAKKFEKDFDLLKIGRPLLSSGEDISMAAEVVTEEFGGLEDETLVLMGHGVFNEKNGIYLELEKAVNETGRVRAFVGTVEAEPSLETVLEKARASETKKVVLAPLLIVSGDHATNDMAGDDDESWASAFKNEGIQVRCILRGMGEYEGIRRMLVGHAKEADK